MALSYLHQETDEKPCEELEASVDDPPLSGRAYQPDEGNVPVVEQLTLSLRDARRESLERKETIDQLRFDLRHTKDMLEEARLTQHAAALQAELRSAGLLLEERQQQVRHLQIDLHAAQYAKVEPQISVSGQVVAQAHTQLLQEQRLRQEAEQRAQDQEARAEALLRDLEAERQELAKTRRSLRSANFSMSRSQPSLRLSDPLGPYAASPTKVHDPLESAEKR